ncbi:MAG TPA: DnaJ family domain-containing protein [Bryobacteraceae bacterium]|nr:DnaJ family domain-containing protein [Bryobacteraceae bacterium]
MDKWESIADRKIREAMAEGSFDNLPDKGKPIRLESNPFEDPALWMAHHLLRVNGFAPPWVEEARELEEAAVRLRTDLAEALQRPAADHRAKERAVQQFRERGAELNRRILTYNLKSPSVRFHRRPLDLESEVRAARGQRSLAGDSSTGLP